MEENDRGLSILVHGYSGVGKSTFGVSGLAPCVLMDVENSARWLPHRKKYWNPLEESPPIYDGTWDLCVVKTKNWEVAQKTIQWLKSGQHPFRSVSVDSISELQIKAKNQILNGAQMKMQNWGELLQNMGSMLRDLRDMTGDGHSGIELMALISTSKLNAKGALVPHLEGSIAAQVPYLFDMTGYYYVDMLKNPNTGVLEEHRVLFTGTNPSYEAKSRPPQMPETLLDPRLDEILANLMPEFYGIQQEQPQVPQEPAPLEHALTAPPQ